MKKSFLSVLIFVFSIIMFTNSAIAAEKGSRINPFSAYDENTITLQRYSFETPKQVKIQLLDISSDSTTNAIISNENMFNTKPAVDEQWSLFKYKITYLSSNKDEELKLSDVIAYYANDFYFDSSYKSIDPISTATLGDLYGNLAINKLSIYPGTNTLAYTGALFKKKDQYPYFRIKKANGDYYWFSTDPSYKPSEDTAENNNSNSSTNTIINFSSVDLKAIVNGDFPTYSGSALKPNISIYADENKLTQNQDYTLTLSNNINVGYGLFTVRGIGNYTGSQVFKFQIKPKSTEIYSIKNSKAKSVTLRWDSVIGAKYYKVYYKTGSTTKNVQVAGTSTTVNKLTKNKTYKFHVVAYYDSTVFSSNSNTKTIKIKK